MCTSFVNFLLVGQSHRRNINIFSIYNGHRKGYLFHPGSTLLLSFSTNKELLLAHLADLILEPCYKISIKTKLTQNMA